MLLYSLRCVLVSLFPHPTINHNRHSSHKWLCYIKSGALRNKPKTLQQKTCYVFYPFPLLSWPQKMNRENKALRSMLLYSLRCFLVSLFPHLTINHKWLCYIKSGALQNKPKTQQKLDRMKYRDRVATIHTPVISGIYLIILRVLEA